MHKKAFLTIKMILIFSIVTLLQSCYIPSGFTGSYIKILRNGDYTIHYTGYLINLELYQALQSKKIRGHKSEMEAVRSQQYLLKQMAGPFLKQIKYYKRGAFHVEWERKGNIVRDKKGHYVLFYERHNNIFSLKFDSTTNRDWIIFGTPEVKTKHYLGLLHRGIKMTGTFKIITDGKVIKHNAPKNYRDPTTGYNVYEWKHVVLGKTTHRPELIIQY